MKKTGNIFSKLNTCITACLTLLFVITGYAQDDDVTFEMELSKESLGVNERLRVDFSMNKDGDNFTPPNFDGFSVVMGPSQSTRSTYANGVRSFSRTYSYILQPKKQGKITIQQASIVINNKTYKSIPKTVQITGAVDRPNAPKTVDDVVDDQLYLTAEVSKTSPYLNEAITVVYKLYFGRGISVSNFRQVDNPTYNNFWTQNLPVTKYNVQNATYNGKPFNSVVLKRVVMYPQTTGKLDIEPLTLDISVDVPTSRRDFFGQPIYTQTSKIVSAGKRTLTIKTLPEKGKPADFNGAVGDFDFSVTTSKTSLNASESMQVKVVAEGGGNLKLFQLPELKLPSALEVYEPEYDENIRTNLGGMQGKVSNSYTVVPAYKGKYPIPSVQFSFFNPKTEQYETISSEELQINVIEGPTSASVSTGTPGGATKQMVTAVGDDFKFLKLNANLTSISNTPFIGSKAYFLWLLLPLFLIPIAILAGKKKNEMASDVVGNKIKKANKLARKYLSAAKKTLGQKDAFYVALEKALHNYLKAKLKIETSEFSKDKIEELLLSKKVDGDTTNQFIALLSSCEMARYSQFTQVQMQQDYDGASTIITQLDKQL